jgi:hypothetical protein
VASKKTRQVIVFSAFAVAAAAGPVIAATALSTSAPQSVQAAPGGECLAWFGNQEDGHCLGYSNGNGTNIGTPWGIYGPNNYQNGGLLPGQTFNRGIN